MESLFQQEPVLVIPECLEKHAKDNYPEGYFFGMKIVVNKHLKGNEWYVEES